MSLTAPIGAWLLGGNKNPWNWKGDSFSLGYPNAEAGSVLLPEKGQRSMPISAEV